MLIRSYGLFWRRDEVDWAPGRGHRGAFRLLGRRGANRPGIRLADFRWQQGIYILYGEYGPHYVGLTRKQGLGKRLKDHLTDSHAASWDRFSWFGFSGVNKGKDERGLCTLKALAQGYLMQPPQVIGDVEALLIKAMGLRNKLKMRFADASEWTQVKEHETEKYFSRAG